MMFKKIAAAAALLAAAPAFAAISGASYSAAATANPELFLVVVDNDAKISYTQDLGFAATTLGTVGQSELGYTNNWGVGGSAFDTFLGGVNAANLKWAVVTAEAFGAATVKDGKRLWTTVTAGSDNSVALMNNSQINLAIEDTSVFIRGVNLTGTHGATGTPLNYAINGSSVNAQTDPGISYFGEGSGLTNNLNNRGTFTISNNVNQRASFFYLTVSDNGGSNPLFFDQFGNSAYDGKFELQRSVSGAYNLNYTLQPVPEPGTYGLLLAGLAAVGFVARRRAAR